MRNLSFGASRISNSCSIVHADKLGHHNTPPHAAQHSGMPGWGPERSIRAVILARIGITFWSEVPGVDGYLMDVHHISVHLTDVHLIGVHPIAM
jgi:hypothetical protein